ncbi:MAG: hypothetical protein ACYDBB_15220 [Armatimonadota bacterium]
MGKQVQLLHSIHTSRFDEALRSGLKAVSEYDDLGADIRQGVVYCWMCREDDKLSTGGQRADYIYVTVTVEESRCTVADMEYSSLALMYRQGSGTKLQNNRAAALFAEIYRVTAVPLSGYSPGIFFTPEVLVKGDIAPENIHRILEENG